MLQGQLYEWQLAVCRRHLGAVREHVTQAFLPGTAVANAKQVGLRIHAFDLKRAEENPRRPAALWASLRACTATVPISSGSKVQNDKGDVSCFYGFWCRAYNKKPPLKRQGWRLIKTKQPYFFLLCWALRMASSSRFWKEDCLPLPFCFFLFSSKMARIFSSSTKRRITSCCPMVMTLEQK